MEEENQERQLELASASQVRGKRRIPLCMSVCRIEKNPQLCYTETVSWRYILHSEFSYYRIQQNKPNFECVDVCPAGRSCPTGEVGGSVQSSSSHTSQLCWNEKHCQKGNF